MDRSMGDPWDRSMAPPEMLIFDASLSFQRWKFWTKLQKEVESLGRWLFQGAKTKSWWFMVILELGNPPNKWKTWWKHVVSTSFLFRPRNVKAFNFYVECLQEVWFSFPPPKKQAFEPNSLSPAWSPMERCSIRGASVDPQIRRKWWKLRQETDESGGFVFPVVVVVVVVAGHSWKMTSSNLDGNCIVAFLFLRLFQPWYFQKKEDKLIRNPGQMIYIMMPSQSLTWNLKKAPWNREILLEPSFSL